MIEALMEIPIIGAGIEGNPYRAGLTNYVKWSHIRGNYTSGFATFLVHMLDKSFDDLQVDCPACVVSSHSVYRIPNLNGFLYEIYEEPLSVIRNLPHRQAAKKANMRCSWLNSVDGTKWLIAMRQPPNKALYWAFKRALAKGHITQNQFNQAIVVFQRDGYLPLLDAVEQAFNLKRLCTGNTYKARRYIKEHYDDWFTD
jgi:hypothetical protein